MNSLGWLSAGLAGLALAIAWAPVNTRVGGQRWVAVLAVAGAGLALTTRSQGVVVLAVAAVVAVVWWWKSRERRLARRAVGADVAAFVELLGDELAAGRPLGVALQSVADELPRFVSAASAHELGGDVAAELEALGEREGVVQLRVVAAAWRVAHQTGQGLGVALQRVAEALRAADQTRAVVATELASAAATAKLMAALPIAALLMGRGFGASPWQFLTNSPAGLVCLAGGLLCMGAGFAWLSAISRSVEKLL